MTSSDYDVFNLESLNQNPWCNHGPTILFTNKVKKFYACSACRDHKLCSFYANYDENKSLPDKKLKDWKDRYLEFNLPKSNYKNDLIKAKKLPIEDRKYCQTCNLFLFDSNHNKEHIVLTGLTNEMLVKPIKFILEPLTSNSSNAQFLFDDSTINIITNLIINKNYDSVMCIGTPSIFEKLEEIKSVRRILMDIDERFERFYDNDQFVRYNLFNNHFFDNKERYSKFINDSKKLLIILDPPYGGLIRLIANTIEQIKKDLIHGDVSIILFYPYFIEKWINNWLPNLKMIDFKVTYQNNKKFDNSQKKGSPARLFTNIPSNHFILPNDYKFCESCQKYTFKENKHCIKCNKCTSKDGGEYKHCDECNKCVKTTYMHCIKCKFCHLESIESDCVEKIIEKKRKFQNNPKNLNKRHKI